MPKNQNNTEKISQKTVKFDEKDRKIVNLLNKNGRLTLKEISKDADLSIDAVKGRIDRMKEYGAIDRFTVIPNPKAFGLPLGAHVYVKLHNIEEKKLEDFIRYLKFHNRIVVLMSMLGDYDIYFVVLAKDTADLNSIKTEIRKEFSNLIAEWKEVIVAEIYKYEEYQM